MSAAGCGGERGGAAAPEAVDLYVAASLGEVMTDLQSEFQRTHPDTRVRLSLGASSTLVTQIRNGAPADVFVSADEDNMAKLAAAGLITAQPRVVARNTLSILVRPGNPERVGGLADLDRPGLVVALAAPEVPIGRYARQAFAKAGAPVPEGSNELDVKQVVTRVTLGEADAGVVYASDAKAAAGKAEAVAIPPEHNVEASYPAAVTEEGDAAAGARLFLDFLNTEFARQTLSRHGFLPPHGDVR
jgi:molybdate transport system substrate-binding protein